jgi:hypothetical protein
VQLIVGALLMVFSMWWVYFKRPLVESLTPQTSFVFGYVHYFVFASVAGVGACLATLVDLVQDEADVGTSTAVVLLVAFTSIYLLSVSGIHGLGDRRLSTVVPAITVVLAMWVIALLGLAPGTSVLLVGVAVAMSLADYVRRTNRAV